MEWYGFWKLSRQRWLWGNNNGYSCHTRGFNNGKGVVDANIVTVISQIYFKTKHIAAECRNRYNREYAPSYLTSAYNSYQNSLRVA